MVSVAKAASSRGSGRRKKRRAPEEKRAERSAPDPELESIRGALVLICCQIDVVREALYAHLEDAPPVLSAVAARVSETLRRSDPPYSPLESLLRRDLLSDATAKLLGTVSNDLEVLAMAAHAPGMVGAIGSVRPVLDDIVDRLRAIRERLLEIAESRAERKG
jgi:hypothetical protein